MERIVEIRPDWCFMVVMLGMIINICAIGLSVNAINNTLKEGITVHVVNGAIK